MSSWKEFKTADGLEYYVNEATGETTWDKPEELMTSGEVITGDYSWVPHPEHGYVIAKIKHAAKDGTHQIETVDGYGMEVKLGKTDKIFPKVNFASLKKHMDDLVQMQDVNEATIQYNLKERAKKDIIYTNVGDILISINPYKLLNIYTASVMEEYWHGNTEGLPPHVFTIASDSYRKLFEEKQNQSVIISGESGAGKTEATKVVLQFLAEVAGSTSGVEQRMLSANPILESFGNAKTIRNNNSSRFGKLMEILFDPKARITGCKIQNYLLEKSRVTKQAVGERNFHSFYQLLACPEQKKKLQLGDANQIPYLNQSGCINIDGVSDAHDFEEVTTAMDSLEFSAQEKQEVFNLVAAVLHLGSIHFAEDGTGSKITNSNVLESVSNLLQVPSFMLGQELTIRQFQGSASRSTTYSIPLTPSQASDGRDALAQTLYGNLFNWLVLKINQCLTPQSSNSVLRLIGVLDIFGFEIFEKNSFEQLCINFTNEKLQQHFNAHTFKLEEQVYKDEKISFTHVEFIDNQVVLDLIEKKPNGLLILLDEEIVVPKGTDETFLKKLNQNHEKNERYKVNRTSRTTFTIIHYAGEVIYDVTNFLDKNKDTIPEGIIDVMESSTSSLINALFPPSAGKEAKAEASEDAGRGRGRGRGRGSPAPASPAPAASAGGKTNRKASLGAQFREQLNQLMITLNATEPHYIRCIKPNQNKRPASDDFDGMMALRQLRYAGVFEAVAIRQTGYPFRMTHVDFWKRYRLLAPKAQGSNPKDTCAKLLQEIGKVKNTTEIQIGQTKVLYRATQYRDLELLRNFQIEKSSIIVQAGNRGWKSRIIYKRVDAVRQQLRAAIAKRDLETIKQAIAAVETVDFAPKENIDAIALRDLIIEEIRVTGVLKSVLGEVAMRKDIPQQLLDRLKAVVADADAINFQSTEANNARSQLNEIVDRINTRALLTKSTAESDEDNLKAGLAKAQQLGLSDTEQTVAAAKEELQRIAKENEHIRELKAALSIDRPHPGLQISNQPGSKGQVTLTPQAKQDLISAESQADKFGCRTQVGIACVKTASIILKLRRHLENEDFTEVESLLYETSKLPAGTILDAPEIKAATDQINTRAKKADVQAKLEAAAAVFDGATLAFELGKAATLQMEVQYFQDLHNNIVHAQSLIAEGLRLIEQEPLEAACSFAESFGYNLEDYHQAVHLRDILIGLAAEIDHTLKILESREQMTELYNRAVGVGMHTAPLAELGKLVVLSEEELTKRQLKAALILNDKPRIISLNIKLKEIFFEQFANTFKINECSSIKTPQEYARGKIFGKEKTKIEMMNWQKGGIHASLTRIDPLLQKENKDAVTLFKNLLGYMGDKTLTYPQTLARENIQRGIETPILRDEIYVQIIKQLTQNPNPESAKKGWIMLELCLSHFPPSRTFENYLEIWIRQQGESRAKLRSILHEVLFSGAKTSAPPAEQIP